MSLAYPSFPRHPRVQGVEVLECDQNHTVFTHGHLFVMMWHVDTLIDPVKAVSQRVAHFASRLEPPRIALLTVVEASATPPTAEVRAALAELMQVNAAYFIRSAVAFEGSGFKAAAIRGISTGIALLSRHNFPHRVFAGVLEATRWLAPAMGGELSVPVNGDGLARVVNDVRARRASER